MEVASQLGKGSTFTLTIDAGDLDGVCMLQSPKAPSTAVGIPSSNEQEATLHGRVLLAEDVPDVHVVFRQILQLINLEVEIAEDGCLACEMAEKSQSEGKPFDLILMDIQMPRMNGYEATRWLRQHGWHGPIVALTAHALVGDREKCLAAGCDDYIAKPITSGKLYELLGRYVGQAKGTATSLRETPKSEGILDSGILSADASARLIKQFLEELPARAERIVKAFQDRDRDFLIELTHQLKGTAGLYGYDDISAAACTVCDRARANDKLETLQATMSELLSLCRQASASTPAAGPPAATTVEEPLPEKEKPTASQDQPAKRDLHPWAAGGHRERNGCSHCYRSRDLSRLSFLVAGRTTPALLGDRESACQREIANPKAAC